jgi:nitric oxide reductase subunit C
MSKTNTRLYIICLSILAGTFCYYNYTIYTEPNTSRTAPLSDIAARGQTLWQQNNCFSCHQIYGLGGYLGPDLTNVYSNPDKGPAYIKSMLNSGVKSMPAFNFSDNEKEAIIAYLKEIDQSGQYPNRNAEFDYMGWVKITYKNEK